MKNLPLAAASLFTFILSTFLTPGIEAAFERSEKTLFADQNPMEMLGQKWIKIRSSEKDSLKEILGLIKKSPTGEKLLDKAKSKAERSGMTLVELIEGGAGSLTDTTLVRRFSPDNPEKVMYQLHSKVYLNRDLTVLEAVLDLSHELTHFTMRGPFNPYEKHFALKDFVKSTVEGEGGEVDAYITECRVLFELFPKGIARRFNCHHVLDHKSGELSRERAVEQFYKIGHHYQHFFNELKKDQLGPEHFPRVGQDMALFYSSAYGLPYPLAALEEYRSIVARVCDNDLKRLELMKAKINTPKFHLQGSSEEIPEDAYYQTTDSERNSSYKELKNDYQARCLPSTTALPQRENAGL